MMSPKTKERIATLRKDFRPLAEALLEAGYKAGLNPQVSCAYRSPEEQDALYSVGRTRPGSVVTNAKRWQSSHQYGVSIDVFFLTPDKKADFDKRKYKKLWEAAIKAGLDKKGLTWAGNWTTFPEGPHFELTGFKWREYAEAAEIDLVTLRPKA